MNFQRRKFLHLAAGAVALPALSRIAKAQAYPSRPVHVIVGQAAASSSDITARLMAQWLSEHLGQQFIVEIRPGATGNIATEAVVRAAPDGYTILLVNSQNTINAALFSNLPFDFVHDIAPIAGIFRVPLVMEVQPSFPAKTVPEFIAYAKANPGKINMASAGVGGPQHVAGELFKFMAGVDLVHVPYHGSTPAMTDLLAGQVQVMFDVTPSSLPHIKAGKLRPLAITHDGALGYIARRAADVRLFARAMRRSDGSALARPRIRQPRSSKRSIRNSMRPSPIQRSERVFCRPWRPRDAAKFARRFRASSSPPTPKSGSRW